MNEFIPKLNWLAIFDSTRLMPPGGPGRSSTLTALVSRSKRAEAATKGTDRALVAGLGMARFCKLVKQTEKGVPDFPGA